MPMSGILEALDIGLMAIPTGLLLVITIAASRAFTNRRNSLKPTFAIPSDDYSEKD